MPIGYHGTVDRNARNIISQKKFKPSEKKTEWLGHGVYFFKYKAHAVEWAKKQPKRKKYRKCSPVYPAVVSAELNFTDDQLLDLDDPDQRRLINEYIAKYLEKANIVEVDWKKIDKRKRWCFICNSYREEYDEIKVICHTFNFNETDDEPNLSEFNVNQFQYCVVDESIIRNIQEEVF